MLRWLLIGLNVVIGWCAALAAVAVSADADRVAVAVNAIIAWLFMRWLVGRALRVIANIKGWETNGRQRNELYRLDYGSPDSLRAHHDSDVAV